MAGDRRSGPPWSRAAKAELNGGSRHQSGHPRYVAELALRSRIFSTNHRTIARHYFFLSLLAVAVGWCCRSKSISGNPALIVRGFQMDR